MGALTTANNGTLVTSNTGVPSILAGPGTTGNVLQSNAAAAPSFSTATYPSTTTVSQILYSSATNVVSGLATGNDGVLITSHTGVPSLLAGGTTGQVLTATTNSPPTWAAAAGPTGGPVQQVRTSTAATTALATTIPGDNTIPQSSEGTQVFTLAITPTNSSSILVIEGVLQIPNISSTNGKAGIGVALFQDSTAGALYACAFANNGDNSSISIGFTTAIHFKYYMTAGTTSSTTFKIRAGELSGGTYQSQSCNLNSDSGNTRIFGGVALSTLLITEWKA